jgi:hypothetical protein
MFLDKLNTKGKLDAADYETIPFNTLYAWGP